MEGDRGRGKGKEGDTDGVEGVSEGRRHWREGMGGMG